MVGVITPWNLPLAIPTEYLSACIALGNTIVWNPASLTPLTALHLVECMAQAGVIEGIVNLVLGPGEFVARALSAEPSVVAIGLTGSAATGEAVARLAGMGRTLLELGGNGPAIVAEDADLERAIARIARGGDVRAGRAGPACSACRGRARSHRPSHLRIHREHRSRKALVRQARVVDGRHSGRV